jgi:hypothetical protein
MANPFVRLLFAAEKLAQQCQKVLSASPRNRGLELEELERELVRFDAQAQKAITENLSGETPTIRPPGYPAGLEDKGKG